MRILIQNLGRTEVRECYYAYVANGIENSKLILYENKFNLQISFNFCVRDSAIEALKQILTLGFYDFSEFGNDYSVTERPAK